MDLLEELECSHHHECLICWEKIEFCEGKLASKESLLTKLFSIFSKYMKWKLPPKLKFDFQTDIFPFCKACLMTLIEISKLDEQVTEILEKINVFVTRAALKIVICSDSNNDKIIKGSPRKRDVSSKYKKEKIQFCRNSTIRNYLPDVTLKKTTLLPGQPRSRVRIKEEPLVDVIDEEISRSEDRSKDIPESKLSIGFLEELYANNSPAAVGEDYSDNDNDGMVPIDSLMDEAENSPEDHAEPDNDDNSGEENSEENIPEENSPDEDDDSDEDDAGWNKRTNKRKNKKENKNTNKVDKSQSTSTHSREQARDSIQKSKNISKITQVDDFGFLYDGRLYFEIMPSLGWKCACCNYEYTCRRYLEAHFEKVIRKRKEEMITSYRAPQKRIKVEKKNFETTVQVQKQKKPNITEEDIAVQSILALNGSSMMTDEDFPSFVLQAIHHEEEVESIPSSSTTVPVQQTEGTADSSEPSAVKIEIPVMESNTCRRSKRKRTEKRVYDPDDEGEQILPDDGDFEPVAENKSSDSEDDAFENSGGGTPNKALEAGASAVNMKDELKMIVCTDESNHKFSYNGFAFEYSESGRYKCGHCSFDGASKLALTIHIREYHVGGRGNRRQFYSELNDNEFIYLDTYRYSKVEEGFKCLRCGDIRADNKQMRQHIRRMHVYKASGQSKKYNIKKEKEPQIKRHRNRVSAEMVLAPDETKTFHINSIYQGKNLKLTFEKTGDTFKCVQCSFTTKSRSSIGSHIRHQHVYIKEVICEICGKGFKKPSLLNLHMAAHATTRSFVCDKCGKSFKDIWGLKGHYRHVHRDDKAVKPFKCDLCDAAFAIRSSVNAHMKIKHGSGYGTFDCQVCGKTLKVHAKTRHMRAHANERPYKCAKCDKSFNFEIALKKHTQAIHDKIKYQCTMCSVKCGFGSGLRRHMRRKHGLSFHKDSPHTVDISSTLVHPEFPEVEVVEEICLS